MISAVKSRPNCYEVLRIAPTASAAEIAAAFARELSRPRAFGGIAQVSIAYETLRHPDKRTAYDAALGLKPASAAEPRATDRSPLPAKPVEPQPAAERRVASFIASSLRPAVDADVPPVPTPGFGAQPLQAPPKPSLAQPAGGDHAVRRVELELAQYPESSPIAWQRHVAVAGAVIVAVGLLGAWAGSNATNASAPPQRGRAVTVALPPLQTTIAPVRTAVEVQPERRTRAAVAVARVARAPLAQPPGVVADQQPQAPLAEAQAPVSEPNQDANATGPAIAQGAPIAAAAAHLPLPNAVIARTIGRIGYACGAVAATAAIDGEAPGVFKVTCTSGQSYRAAPVGGHYRFKRLGSP